MHTAESLSESFINWFQSIEGGNYVDEFADEVEKKQKQKQNLKYKGMVNTVLVLFFGEKQFHKSALESLDMIGRSSKGCKSVVEKMKVGRSWGTVRNYLSAFSHFLDFLEVSKSDLVSKHLIPAMKTNLKRSVHSVTRLALEEMQHRKMDDRN